MSLPPWLQTASFRPASSWWEGLEKEKMCPTTLQHWPRACDGCCPALSKTTSPSVEWRSSIVYQSYHHTTRTIIGQQGYTEKSEVAGQAPPIQHPGTDSASAKKPTGPASYKGPRPRSSLPEKPPGTSACLRCMVTPASAQFPAQSWRTLWSLGSH